MEKYIVDLVLPDVIRDIQGDAVPVAAWTGAEGSRRLRDIKVEKFLDLRTGRLYPRQDIFLVFIYFRSWVELRARRIKSMKNFNETNENRNADDAACNAVLQLAV
jgi:hypothetical protein